MDTFTVNLALASQEFEIPEYHDTQEVCHYVVFTFDSVPSAGLVSLDVDPGINRWIPVQELQSKPMVDAMEFRFSYPVTKLRVRLSGVTGGTGCKLNIFHSSEWFADGPPQGLNRGLRANTIQTYTEANVKNGVQFEASTFNDAFPALGTSSFIVLTGSKVVILKGRVISLDGLGLRLETFVNPVYTGGTPVPIYNLNLRNSEVNTVTILALPTVTGDGTKISADKYIIGSNPQGGSAVTVSTTLNEAEGLETILAANSVYHFKSTSIDPEAQRVHSYNTWYEGGTDLP